MGIENEKDISHTVEPTGLDYEHQSNNAVQQVAKSTHRHLKPRHVQLIAISGAIGTGLYIGTSGALATAGPIGLLLGYTIYGVLVLSTFNAMGEMVSYLPIDGSYISFASRFVDSSYGFAMGWLVFYNYSVTVAAEAVAVAGMINYWNDTISNGVWCALFLIVCFTINVVGVKWFGEGEFYFSIFKVLLIVGLLIFTFITMVGGNPKHDVYGFRNWKKPEPIKEYIAEGGLGKFLAIWSTFVGAAYAYGGPDYLSMTAGESKHARKVMPSVFRRVISRLMVFYIGGVAAVGLLVPANDPDLGSAKKGAGSSAFVLAVVRFGIPGLPSVINAGIMTSAWSCGIANAFSASRVLYAMSLRGQAPRFFQKTTKGVPIYCVALVHVIGLLSFLSLDSGGGAARAFSWLVNILGGLWILNLGLQHIIYIRFRKGVAAQGVDRSSFPFFKKNQLIYSWICVFAYGIIFITNGFAVFTTGQWEFRSFAFAYMTLALFLVLYLGHKIYAANFGKEQWGFLPPGQIDLVSGLAEVEQDEMTAPPPPTNRLGRFTHWLWGA